MACPNQSTTVTIPISGSATINPVDNNSCLPLDPTKVTGLVVVNNQQSGLNATTQPAMTVDAGGVHLSANGLSLGASMQITFTYTPNGKTWAMTAMVGQAVTPVGTTATP